MDSNFMPGCIKDDILYNILGYMKASMNISGMTVNWPTKASKVIE